ncbi:MAG: hypothetical protein R3C97_10935 [Geminicoccaceae bacterium]
MPDRCGFKATEQDRNGTGTECPCRRRRWLRVFRHARRGGTAIEYALLAAVVAITAFAGLRLLGGESSGMWKTTGDTIVQGMKQSNTP